MAWRSRFEQVELARKPGGLDRIFGEQKARTKRGIADAPARIDARADEKAEMPAFRRPRQTRDIEKSRQTRRPRPRMTMSPCRTKARLRPTSGTTSATVASATRSSCPAGRAPADRRKIPVPRRMRLSAHQRQEHHAGGAEMAEAREVVEPVRINDRRQRREAAPAPGGGRAPRHRAPSSCFRQGHDAGGSAIDRDEEPRALLLEAANGLDIRAITLGDPVGDMDEVVEPAGAQVFRQQGRAAAPSTS